MSDEETEGQLDKVVKLLAYISDKDLFSDFSASDELERSILSRLKQQCGAQFTSKVNCSRKAFHLLAVAMLPGSGDMIHSLFLSL